MRALDAGRGVKPVQSTDYLYWTEGSKDEAEDAHLDEDKWLGDEFVATLAGN